MFVQDLFFLDLTDVESTCYRKYEQTVSVLKTNKLVPVWYFWRIFTSVRVVVPSLRRANPVTPAAQNFDQNTDIRGQSKRSMNFCLVGYWYGRSFFSRFKWSPALSYEWGKPSWRRERVRYRRRVRKHTAKIKRSQKRWETLEAIPPKVCVVYRSSGG